MFRINLPAALKGASRMLISCAALTLLAVGVGGCGVACPTMPATAF